MYLLLLDDGLIFKTKILQDDDRRMCDLGLLQIIDMPNEKIYVDGEWIEIEEYTP